MTGAKVLIVDDSELVRETVRMTLEDEGFAVATLASAFGINNAIRDNQPDVILLDVNMPGLPGDKAAAILSRRRFLPTIPLLLHSDLEETKLAELAQTARASGFIRKSFNNSQLVQQLRPWIGGTCARSTRPTLH